MNETILVLNNLIERIKRGELRMEYINSSSPVKEVAPRDGYRRFERTGDFYVTLHFKELFRKGGRK